MIHSVLSSGKRIPAHTGGIIRSSPLLSHSDQVGGGLVLLVYMLVLLSAVLAAIHSQCRKLFQISCGILNEEKNEMETNPTYTYVLPRNLHTQTNRLPIIYRTTRTFLFICLLILGRLLQDLDCVVRIYVRETAPDSSRSDSVPASNGGVNDPRR